MVDIRENLTSITSHYGELMGVYILTIEFETVKISKAFSEFSNILSVSMELISIASDLME